MRKLRGREAIMSLCYISNVHLVLRLVSSASSPDALLFIGGADGKFNVYGQAVLKYLFLGTTGKCALYSATTFVYRLEFNYCSRKSGTEGDLRVIF